MKKIYLVTKGKIAIVDDEDFDFLNQWKWYCNVGGYVMRHEKQKNYKRNTIWMHRLINNTPEGFDTDHINRNKLDNRKNNLRSLLHGKNLMNMGSRKNNISGKIGVGWHAMGKKWRAYISLNGKYLHLGDYKYKKDAIVARKKGELTYHLI
jgi:hypothetical protein